MTDPSNYPYDTSQYEIHDHPMRLVNTAENVVIQRAEFEKIKEAMRWALSNHRADGNYYPSTGAAMDIAMEILEKHGGGK